MSFDYEKYLKAKGKTGTTPDIPEGPKMPEPLDAEFQQKVISSNRKKEEGGVIKPAGTLDDGYQAGDFLATVGGTVGDVAVNAAKGLYQGFEGLTDLGFHGASNVASWVGADKASDWLKREAMADSSQKLFGKAEDYFDRFSGLGEKGDAIANMLGYIGYIATLGKVGEVIGGALGGSTAGSTLAANSGAAAGASTATTIGSGLSSMGHGITEAYQEKPNATAGQAWTYGLMKGAVDAGSELVFGGLGKGINALGYSRGLTSLDDVFARELSEGISNQFWKNMVQFGVKASAEGAEEVLAGLGTAVAKKLTYMSDEELAKLVEDENLREQFIMGVVVSGMMQSGYIPGTYQGSLLEANRTGMDLVAGATAPVPGKTEAQNLQAPNAGEDVSYMQDMADRLSPVQTAIDQLNQNGTVSNRVAEIILGNSQALAQIREQTGVEITGTRAQQRNAVKEAVAQIVQQQAQEATRLQAQAAEKTEQEKAAANFDAAVKEMLGIDTAKQKAYNESIKNGGVENGAETTRPSGAYPGRIGKNENVESAARAENGNRSRVSEALGENGIRPETAVPDRPGGLTGHFSEEDYYYPPDGSELKKVQESAEKEYGVPCHIVKAGAWTRENKAFSRNGEIYVSEDIDPDTLRTVVAHETTHVMKQAGFSAYLDFANRTPDMIDFDSEFGQSLLALAGNHAKVDIFSMDDSQSAKLYDELNSIAYGMYDAGIFEDSAFDYSWIPGAFKDFDSYIQELEGIHAQFKSQRNAETESVGAAPAGFTDFKGEYYDQLTDENAQPDRPGDVRPMEVLKKDSRGRQVSEFAANAYGAEVTTDEMADRIQELINDGALGFDTRSNTESLKQAHEAIKAKGAAATLRQITNHMANGKLQDGDIEKAMLLYADYASQKSQNAQDNAAELMVDLATMANMTGRNLQLFKMLRRMTPQGQYMTIQKTVDRYVDSINKKRGEKHQAEVVIPAELKDAYMEAAYADSRWKSAETEKAKAEAEQEIIKFAASQIKASPMEKLNAWRYMAMLGNLKTQSRNVIGNAAFRPLVNTKRAVGAAIETMTLEKNQRTKAVLGIGKEAQALREWARADAKGTDAQSLISYTARTGDAVRSELEDARKIYDTKALEVTREFIQKVPEAADMIFKRWEYEISLASFMKARGYTASQLNAGEVAANVIAEGREYAALESMKATFNDRNAFSDALSNLRYKGNNKAWQAVNILAEGVMPFRRTPANIAVRAVEYSPVGFVRGVGNLTLTVKSGKVSAATAIDQMAAGLTGTGAMVLGYALASGILGIKLVGNLDEDDEKNAGRQAYSLEIGGKSYSIDWLAPANLPLFIGANLYQSWTDEDRDNSWVASTLSSFALAFEPMLELSCLSSLQDIIEDAKYAEKGTEIYTIVASAATSYFNQMIPTLFGQIEQAVEANKNQVYANADTPVERMLQKAAGYASQKVPFVDLFQTTKYDQWGQPVEQKNWFDALINPANKSELSTDPVDAEILRLNDAQTAADVTNNGPDSKLSYTDSNGNRHEDYRLSGEEWEAMQKAYGQTAHKVLQELIESDGYARLTDEQKAKAFGYAYAYAREAGRIAALEDYPGYSEAWMEEAGDNVAEAIFVKTVGAAFSNATTKIKTAFEYGKPTTEGVEALQQAYDIYKGMSDTQRKSLLESLSGSDKYAAQAMEAGLNAVEFADIYTALQGIAPEQDRKEVRAVQKVEAIADADYLSESERKAVMKIYLSDSQDEALDRVTAAGYSAEMYTAVYRADLEQSGMDATVRALIKQYGMSLAAAQKLYNAYKGK